MSEQINAGNKVNTAQRTSNNPNNVSASSANQSASNRYTFSASNNKSLEQLNA